MAGLLSIIYIYIYIWVVILPIDFHIFQDGNIAPPSSKKWEGTGRGVMKTEWSLTSTHTSAVCCVISTLGSPFKDFFFENQPAARYISYLEWSSGVKLSEINEMVRGCKHQGPAILGLGYEHPLLRGVLKRTMGYQPSTFDLGIGR